MSELFDRYMAGGNKMTKTQLKKYWKELTELEKDFESKITVLEKKMQKETGIKDLEFFWGCNGIVGIGNASRTMSLIHRYRY